MQRCTEDIGKVQVRIPLCQLLLKVCSVARARTVRICAPMQATATSAVSWPPTSTIQDFTAEGEAKAATHAPRAASTSVGGRCCTGTVLYVFSRRTLKPRCSRPSCRAAQAVKGQGCQIHLVDKLGCRCGSNQARWQCSAHIRLCKPSWPVPAVYAQHIWPSQAKLAASILPYKGVLKARGPLL